MGTTIFQRISLRWLLSAVLIAGIAPRLPRAIAGDKPAPAAPKVSLQSAWDDLAGDNQAKIARAALVLGRSPGEGVAFLKQNLRPVKADPKLLERWLNDLDAEESGTRALAQEELEYLDKYIKDDLKKALEKPASTESRKRIQKLLERIETAEKNAKPPAAAPGLGLKGRSVSISNVNGQITIIVDGVPLDLSPRIYVPAGPPRHWVRAVRAIGVLEGLGTPEARQLIEALARGEADALPTIEARAALGRLGKQ
jgi:hypothetical protein